MINVIFKIECHTEIKQKYLCYYNRFFYPLISILNKVQRNFTNYLKLNLIQQTIFQSEVKRWLKHYEQRIKPVHEQNKFSELMVNQGINFQSHQIALLMHFKQQSLINPDSPIMRTISAIGYVSTIGSIESKCASFGIRRLKTPYQRSMSGSR